MSESSLVPRVSSDGFSSDLSDRKTDYYQATGGGKTVSKQASRLPGLRLMEGTGSAKKADEIITSEDINFGRDGGDDLLYQWRVARKMELARLSRARSGLCRILASYVDKDNSLKCQSITHVCKG